MLFLYVVFGIGLFVLLMAGVREQRSHLKNLDSIHVRVLVNGIRGKSSITRLCAGALRGGGLHVAAKTTGSAARFIWPDASESPVFRTFGVANVVEQIRMVRLASSEHVDALVMECMAVDPGLQEVTQDRLVRSTIGVISNVREDHITEMGPTLEDIARSLSRTMPRGGTCITAETAWLPVLQQEADRRGCRLVHVDPSSVSDEEMDPFRYFTFKENVALALAVAQEAGISRGDALRGMWRAEPDPGVLTVERYSVGNRVLYFANVFAANDPSSTLMNVRQLVDSNAIRPPIFTLINCRPDRIERNRQMGALVPGLLAEKVFLIGHPTRSAKSALPESWDGKLVDLGGQDRDAESIFRSIIEEVDREASLVAIGNIHGQGEKLLEHLEGLGVLR